MFGWFKRRREAKRLYEEDVELAEAAPRLHGVNLLEWQYLGRTVISYKDPDSDAVSSSATFFAFCGHEDTNKRHFVLIPHSKYISFDTHTWVLEHAALWEIGERNLWDVVVAEPSKWLRNYMLETFNEVWSQDVKWWVSKNTPAPRKKTKLELVKDVGSDNNVVKLDFKKPETT